MDASAKLLAIVAIAAFVTERVLAGAAYLMDTVRYLRLRRGAGVRIRARAQRKLVLLALAGAIAYVVVDRADLRILRLLDVGSVHPLADFWLTWLAVFAGADRVRDMMSGKVSAAPRSAETPVLFVKVNDGKLHELPRTAA
jgi:hypothetical protein